jgi:hypothetical protein
MLGSSLFALALSAMGLTLKQGTMKTCISLLKGFIFSAALALAPAMMAVPQFSVETELTPTNPAPFQLFGLSVAISGNIAVVGVPFNPFSANAGSAYVFVRKGGDWVFQQQLSASDAAAGDQFGVAVDVSGNTIVVGAPNRRAGTSIGAVYVFERSGATWTEQSIIMSSDPGRPFGFSVALHGRSLAVGALEDHLAFGGTSDAGLAYVFVLVENNWVQQAELISIDIPAFNRTGVSVDIDGNTVVVGTVQSSMLTPGAAYVFSRKGNTWSQQAKLSSTNSLSPDFGHSVSLAGGTIAVGDSLSDTVFVFDRKGQNWLLQQTLAGAPGSQFGSAVVLHANRLLIGARLDNTIAAQAGAAYLFVHKGKTWTLQQTLLADDGAAGDVFGTAANLSGSKAIIGAPLQEVRGVKSGAAYIFQPGKGDEE